MKDFVSRWINVVLLSASLMVVGGIFLPVFPWSSLVFVSVALSVALWMASRRFTPSTAQVIRDIEAEPVRVTAPVQKTVL